MLARMPNALEVLVGEMTLRELAAKSQRSVDQIVAFAMRNGAAARTPKAAAPARADAASVPKKAGRAGKVNTRSASGRAAYEQAVYDTIAGSKGKIAATQIRAKIGGTPQQARAALNRLIEQGRLTYEGKARATRYSLA
jgi:hypothetical protein